MSIGHNSGPTPPEARSWPKILGGYQKPSYARSLAELAVTGGPFLALWAAAWLVYYVGYWWVSLLLTFPAGVFLVRLFMIQHDCGHGSFFARQWMNDWLGRVLGVLTMTPYDFWRRTHAIHHATSGNLTKRGIGDVNTLTLREYNSLSAWGRWKYRLYRHPIVLFGIGPAYLFLLQHRLPIGLMLNAGWTPWISTQATNAAVALIAAGLIWLIGVQAFFLVHLPIILIAASIGVWLFYVQHQFEDTFWSEQSGWSFHEAALQGSSYYELPGFLRWLTANIGIHHVHHMCARIPYYRLNTVLADHPSLKDVSRLTFFESLGCVKLALWDEDQQRMISFRQARGHGSAA